MDWPFARNRQNISVNDSKPLFHAVMGETLGDSLIDPESDAFDMLSANISQGKVGPDTATGHFGCFGRVQLFL